MSAIYDSDGCLVTRDPVKDWQDAAKHGLAHFPFTKAKPKGKGPRRRDYAAYMRWYRALHPARRLKRSPNDGRSKNRAEYTRQYRASGRDTWYNRNVLKNCGAGI